MPNLAVRSIISIFISGVLIIATGVYLYFGSDSNQTSVVDNMEPAIENNIPTALDVYRGKTELEITYKDSVAIDSTVVYKKIK